jgi:hypothetical protein
MLEVRWQRDQISLPPVRVRDYQLASEILPITWKTLLMNLETLDEAYLRLLQEKAGSECSPPARDDRSNH